MFTLKSGCGGAISMTERSCVPPISKVEHHIADRFCAILWCSVNTYSPRRGSKIRSFSNDDGDSNENVKKAIGLQSKKKTTLHVHHSFCTFLCRRCTTTTWKCLIASFMKDVNKRRRISFSFSKLECGPQEINSMEIRLHLPFLAIWNKRNKDWKKREFILKLTFSLPLPLPSSMLKLPINTSWDYNWGNTNRGA